MMNFAIVLNIQGIMDPVKRIGSFNLKVSHKGCFPQGKFCRMNWHFFASGGFLSYSQEPNDDKR